jgi:hypothetical protein
MFQKCDLDVLGVADTIHRKLAEARGMRTSLAFDFAACLNQVCIQRFRLRFRGQKQA